MLQNLIEMAGCKPLLQDARKQADAQKLAKVPDEIQHFDLESFRDRPQTFFRVSNRKFPGISILKAPKT